jgi:ubiquitin carboxyl-terminal hydrolase 34
MKDDTDPVTPQTPEHKPAASEPTPRSSRVTINVRTPSRALETIPSSPTDSEKELEQDATADMLLDDDVKISVEETEVDMTTSDTPDRHLASSGSETSSPPVEVVTLDQDDDPEYESAQPQVTLLHGAQDPTHEFPFHDASESFPETVSRLTSFMSSRMCACLQSNRHSPLTQDSSYPDETVAKLVSDWIQSYINFAKVSDHYAIWDSYQENRELWHSIPELVNCILVRRYVLVGVSPR